MSEKFEEFLRRIGRKFKKEGKGKRKRKEREFLRISGEFYNWVDR